MGKKNMGQFICDQSENSNFKLGKKPKIYFYDEKHVRKEWGECVSVGVKKESEARGGTRGADK